MEDLESQQERDEALARGRAEFAVKQAQEDLSDIRELNQSDWFKRYFVRRLLQKRERIIEDLLTGDGISDFPAYVAKRAEYRLVKEILGMPAADQMAARKDLTESNPQSD